MELSTSSARALASRLFDHLLAAANKGLERAGNWVWKYNMRLITALFSRWKSGIQLAKLPLLNMLTIGDNKSSVHLSAADRWIATGMSRMSGASTVV